MTTVLNYNKIKEELAFFIRNNNVLTTTQREVTTATATGTFAAATNLIISVTNVKNVRSVTVGGALLVYGTDYTVDVNYNNAGVISCKLTFTVAQTGVYSIPYDYGTEHVWTDIPQRTTTISDFPIIGMQIIGEDSVDADIPGEVQLTNFSISVIVYGPSTRDIDDIIGTLKALFIANKKDFYYNKYLQPIALGPILPFGPTSNKIFQRSYDLLSQYNEELI